jgi:putative transposase
VQKSIDSLCQSVKHHLRQWTRPGNQALVLDTALDVTLSKSELLLENMLLRQQLIVLKRHAKRPTLTWRDRTLFVLPASKLPEWKTALVIVQPDTVLRWHRALFRRVWRRKSRPRRRGRLPLTDDIVALIKRMISSRRTISSSERRLCSLSSSWARDAWYTSV